MATYAITMSDGPVAILETVGDATPADCIGRWPAAEQARVTAVAPIDRAVIPADRTFRNAWVLSGQAIAHDMAAARDIWRDKLRAARAPLLAALDEAYLRADEKGDAQGKATVAAQKQALRDAPAAPAIDAAATPVDLVAVTLAVIAPAAVAAATVEAAADDPADAAPVGGDAGPAGDGGATTIAGGAGVQPVQPGGG